jgi:phospholipid/cholesterol/gamma-HCH transport system substrate-binding protein
MKKFSRRGIPGAGPATLFTLVSALLLGVLGIVMGDFRFQESQQYRAVFTTTTGLTSGSDVRAAGVTLGRVTSVTLRDDNLAEVSFTAATEVPVTTNTFATIRYLNLTGDMYLDLTQDAQGGTELGAGDLIPAERTRPALDLDELFNGFRPLLRGLEPGQVNELTSNIIAVFEGQSSSINALLGNVAEFTMGLADQEEVIGSLIDNLNAVLGTLDGRKAEVNSLVTNLEAVIGGLAEDRRAIGDSLEQLTTLTTDGTAFLRSVRQPLKLTLAELRRVAEALNMDLAAVEKALGLTPDALRRLGRVGAYGSFYNLYLCGISVTFTGPDGRTVQGPVNYDTSERCHFQDGDSQ